MCLYCNNRGIATITKNVLVNNKMIICEFGVTCHCKDGIFKSDMNYPIGFELETEIEKYIYKKLTSSKNIKEACPW